jgi:3,4-dihydroxy 2-butanone 4-phosphate synthase/GTP cyclohydrolase II
MEIIAEKGEGVIVLVRHGEANSLSSVLSESTEPLSDDQREVRNNERLVEYGTGAQILSDIGVRKIILLSDSAIPKVIGLDAFDLEIVGQKPVSG